MGWTMRVLEFFAKRRERRRILVITINVAQQAGQLFESRGIDSAVFLQAVVRPRAKLIKIPSGFGYTDHRYIKMSALHHRLQRRENLLVGQVAGCTEEDQSVGMRIAHTLLLPSLTLSEWFSGRFHTCDAFVFFLWLDRVRVPSCERRFTEVELFSATAFSHRRNPPRNALALSPARQPAGSFLSFRALPPPSTTSSGSRAATRRFTASVT